MAGSRPAITVPGGQAPPALEAQGGAGKKSDFFTGPGHLVLVLDGEHIREMRISET
jgi:hypothetical protein